MLKNLSDYLSFLTLIFAVIFSVLTFLRSFVSNKKDVMVLSRMDYLRNYLDNEDE